MTSTRAIARLALLASVAVLPACGLSVENSARVAGLERDLTASQARGQELTARVGELERTLAAERRARGDLAAIERRLAMAQRELGSAQQGRTSADVETTQLRQRVEEETRRLAALQPRPRRRRRSASSGAARWPRPTAASPPCATTPMPRTGASPPCAATSSPPTSAWRA